MNKQRRKVLSGLLNQLTEIKDRIEEAQSEEEEYRDNLPENLQASERFHRAEEACNNLCDAASSLDEAIDCIESAIEA